MAVMVSAKRAFVAGINGYQPGVAPRLRAATFDAIAMRDVLAPAPEDPLRQDRWFDASTPRWDVELWCDRTVLAAELSGTELSKRAKTFFDGKVNVIEGADLLFFFSGHATDDDLEGTVLLGADGTSLSFLQLMAFVRGAVKQHPRTVTVILDCCYSGDLANVDNEDPFMPSNLALIPSNCSILSATSPDQLAKESATQGLFTEHLLGGLKGAAADIVGDVTPLSLYSHASLSLSDDAQRPVFKSNSVERTPVLTSVVPQVTRSQLVQLARHFPRDRGDEVRLTIHHEGIGPDHAQHDPVLDEGYVKRGSDQHKAFVTGSQAQRDLDLFKVLRDSHLLRSKDGRDFWFLCTEPPTDGSGRSDLIVLTPLGKYYRDLVVSGRITEEPEETTP